MYSSHLFVHDRKVYNLGELTAELFCHPFEHLAILIRLKCVSHIEV